MSVRFCHFVGTAIAATLMLAASTASAQEASDDLGSATAIAAVPFTGVTPVAGATTAGDEPKPGCIFSSGFETGDHSVWYRYSATANGPLEAHTAGSNYDTVLVVWDAGPAGAEVGCNDDFYGLQSSVSFNAQAGHTYYFQIAFWTWPTFVPDPTLVFTLAPPPPPLEATVTMDPIGRAAGATGVVEISGTVTCNRFAFVRAIVHVQQQNGRIAASGLFLDAPCGPQPLQVSGRFVGQNARFTPGQATITILGEAFEAPFLPGAPIYTQTSIRLQGASPKTLFIPPPPQP
jgi:hypothetical protein